MKKKTMGLWMAFPAGIIIISTIIIAGILLDPVSPEKPANTELQKSQVYERQKFYEDDGSGIIIISRFDRNLVKKGYLQWKKDYPERAKKIVATAISPANLFMLIYETE